MPAKAVALSMNQFNGYNGCTHCLLIGRRVGPRLLYPCDVQFRLRDPITFQKHAREAQEPQTTVAGLKGISAFNSILSLPFDAPIDAMHQCDP